MEVKKPMIVLRLLITQSINETAFCNNFVKVYCVCNNYHVLAAKIPSNPEMRN